MIINIYSNANNIDWISILISSVIALVAALLGAWYGGFSQRRMQRDFDKISTEKKEESEFRVYRNLLLSQNSALQALDKNLIDRLVKLKNGPSPDSLKDSSVVGQFSTDNSLAINWKDAAILIQDTEVFLAVLNANNLYNGIVGELESYNDFAVKIFSAQPNSTTIHEFLKNLKPTFEKFKKHVEYAISNHQEQYDKFQDTFISKKPNIGKQPLGVNQYEVI